MLALLAGCGGSAVVVAPTSTPAASRAAAPSGSTALSPALTITLANENKAEHVKLGQVVDVALQADSGMENWQVQNPDPAILQPTVNPAAAAVRGVTLRAFKAIGPGSATIQATDRPVCNPGQACSHVVRGFKTTVVVDPS